MRSSGSRFAAAPAGMQVLVLLALAAPFECPRVESPTEARVMVEVRPGKPSAPTERIEIERRLENVRLTAIRSTPEGEILARGSAEVSEADFQRVWRVVQAEDLTQLDPSLQPREGFDLGSVRVALRWRPAGRRSDLQNEISWTGRIGDVEAVQAVVDILRELVGTYLPDITLFYLDRGPGQGV